MTDTLLFLLLMVLVIGFIKIQRKLNQIKKVRELNAHDIKYMKEILTYLGRLKGFESSKDR